MQSLPSLDDIRAAAARIAPYAHRTPVLTSAFFDRLTGGRLFFKCENFQKVGAFKFRGACNAVFSLREEALRHGVATHSSGNHAQALALAARLRGTKAYIVMPRNAPQVKQQAVADYGAQIIPCEPTVADREAEAAIKAAALDRLLDKTLSVDAVRVYKPRAEVYRLVTDAFKIEPRDVVFVSSNRWDVMGASAFGFRAVWVNRAKLPDEYAGHAPAAVVPDLAALPDLSID